MFRMSNYRYMQLLIIVIAIGLLVYVGHIMKILDYSVLREQTWLKYTPTSNIISGHTISTASTVNDTKRCSTRIPCTIWMLWDKGWDRAPILQAVCLRSWKRYNPDYNVRALNIQEAEHLINRSEFYSDDAWASAAVQAKADIIRVELLAKYGGIWADASLYCNEPLANWIDGVLKQTVFFVYERNDSDVKTVHRPWISNWFIASANNSKLIQMWLQNIRSSWSKSPYPNKIDGYFWAQRMFAKLVKTNDEFKQEFKKMFYIASDAPHCFISLPNGRKPHVYKSKTPACTNVRNRLIAEDKIIRKT